MSYFPEEMAQAPANITLLKGSLPIFLKGTLPIYTCGLLTPDRSTLVDVGGPLLVCVQVLRILQGGITQRPPTAGYRELIGNRDPTKGNEGYTGGASGAFPSFPEN